MPKPIELQDAKKAHGFWRLHKCCWVTTGRLFNNAGVFALEISTWHVDKYHNCVNKNVMKLVSTWHVDKCHNCVNKNVMKLVRSNSKRNVYTDIYVFTYVKIYI